MTAAALSLMLLTAGYPPAQADAVHAFMCRATCSDRNPAHRLTADLNPCANSRLGEGLVDATRGLRRELHRYAAGIASGPVSAVRRAERPNAGSCVPPEIQIAFLKEAFPRHYPRAAARFAAGDLSAFQSAWGNGRGN